MSENRGFFLKKLPVLLLLLALTLPGCVDSYPDERSKSEVCTLEFSYTMGSIDPRFGIYEDEAVQLVEQAVALWASAVDTIHLFYSPDADNTIQFIYDERQKRYDRKLRYQKRMEMEDTRIKSLERQYDRQKRELDRLQAEHDRFTNQTENQIKRFNTWVEEINRSGGFSPDKYREYERKKTSLDELKQKEKQKREFLNRRIDEVNAMRDHVNKEIDARNQMLDYYNTVLGDVPSFASGFFEKHGNKGIISIYYFKDDQELLVLLAHEIGHALGLDHVPNEKSIMYPTIKKQMQETGIRLSKEDIKAIRSLCN